jgi:hypothetical protein
MPLRPIFPSNPITRQDQPTTARQKGLYARKRRSSIKKHRKASRTPNRERTTQAKRGPTLLHAHDQIGYRNQGPKGNTETKTVTTSMLRAMEEASKTSGQIPWLHVTVTEAIKERASSLSAPNPFELGSAPSDTHTAPSGSRLIQIISRVSDLYYPSIVW